MEEPSKPTWTRATPWRQGQVLHAESAAALGLAHPSEGATTCAVVIGHDCDLANDNLEAERDVEVIVGRLVDKPDGNFQWGKAPRTLHLEMKKSGAPITVELVATDKRLVSKQQLAAHSPDDEFTLEPRALNVLRAWLAIRYNRAAFPDPFVDRMKALRLDEKLTQTLKSYVNVVSVVFFVVDDGNELDRTDDSAYELSIFLAYVPGDDPEKTADRADEVAEKIEALFAQRCYDKKSGWAGIQLNTCSSISEDDLSVSQAKLLTQWHLEHMSLRAVAAQPRPLAV